MCRAGELWMASECFVGVKPFERALVKLLSSDGVPLPRCSAHPLLSDEPPAPALTWERLHSEVHPAGTAAGGALPASRKEEQKGIWAASRWSPIPRVPRAPGRPPLGRVSVSGLARFREDHKSTGYPFSSDRLLLITVSSARGSFLAVADAGS